MQTGQAERLIRRQDRPPVAPFRDAVDLMETAADEGWPLYIADIDADLMTSNGRLVARMLAAISEDERDRIRQRTKAALSRPALDIPRPQRQALCWLPRDSSS